jgi:hypothetical protein
VLASEGRQRYKKYQKSEKIFRKKENTNNLLFLLMIDET